MNKGICFKCSKVVEFDSATPMMSCQACKKPNVTSVAVKRYEAVKKLDTVTYNIKLDPNKEVKVLTDEHVILLLMDAVQGREMLSAGFVEAFEFIRSSLTIKPQVKLEELE